MSALKFSCILMIFLFAISSFFLIATAKGISENEATLASNDADGTVVSAYLATLKAEEAGANVSGLLIQLDEAGGFLARAHMAYRSGNFDETIHFANLSKNIGEEVQNAADRLEILALSEGHQRLLFTMIGSIACVILTVLGSFWGWRIFKRRYFKRVLKMKPEVASNGT